MYYNKEIGRKKHFFSNQLIPTKVLPKQEKHLISSNSAQIQNREERREQIVERITHRIKSISTTPASLDTLTERFFSGAGQPLHRKEVLYG